MPANPPPRRRDFLKTAAAGAAGAMGLCALRFDKLFAQSTGGWVSGLQVNPAIDNKRVICCHDANMLTSTPPNTSWANQNNSVNANLVASNLDQMAMQLAQKTTVAEAWSAIFRSSKQWASTKVAIKTNGIQGSTGNHPRVAIIKKICDVFIDQLGVPAANIILYDANSSASTSYSTYASLTDTTKIRATVSVKAQSLGGMVPVTIAGSTKAISAVADLVNGVIDILVDIASLKIHSGPGTSYGFGGCSLCMKNHLGTFINQGTETGSGDASSTGLHSLDAVFNINKHAAILGGNPVRQQLCIVDGLLANGGSSAAWSVRTDRIVMGTFAPIVDYFTATKILLNSTIMAGGPMPAAGVTSAAILVPQYLTSFGYATTDALQWVELGPGGTSTGTGGAGGGGGTSAAGGAGGGGTSTAGGSRSGGTSAAGGVGNGGTSAPGGAGSDGTSAAGAAGSSGTSWAGGAGSGGVTAAGGTTGSGGTVSGGAGGTDRPATTAASASGGSASAGETSAGTGTAASSTGGSTETAGASVSGRNSGSGCSVAGVDRRTTRWGALLAFGAAAAERIRCLVSNGPNGGEKRHGENPTGSSYRPIARRTAEDRRPSVRSRRG